MRIDPIQSLADLMQDSGAKLQIGLRAQGHVPIVEKMLADGSSWDEIGRAIGWHGSTAKDWYERFETENR